MAISSLLVWKHQLEHATLKQATMSNQNFTSFSSSSVSYSSSSSNIDGQVSKHQASHHTVSDPSGTTVTSSRQANDGPAVEETRHYDAQGRELLSGGNGSDVSHRIQDVSDEEQSKRDAEYMERMEDESVHFPRRFISPVLEE